MAGDQVRSILERILRLKEEQDALSEDVREVYAEAKANGFDKTALGQVVAYLRKREKDGADKLAERTALFDLYLGAFDGRSHARARTREIIDEFSPKSDTNEAKSDECARHEKRPAGEQGNSGVSDHGDRGRLRTTADERTEQAGDNRPDQGRAASVSPSGHRGGAGRAPEAEGLVLPPIVDQGAFEQGDNDGLSERAADASAEPIADREGAGSRPSLSVAPSAGDTRRGADYESESRQSKHVPADPEDAVAAEADGDDGSRPPSHQCVSDGVSTGHPDAGNAHAAEASGNSAAPVSVDATVLLPPITDDDGFMIEDIPSGLRAA